MYLILAWRNIWRNPRRTTVILLAVVIGVASMILLSALTRGVINGMIDNGIATLTGHLQIHRAGFRNDPVIDYRIDAPGLLLSQVERTLPKGVLWSTRLRLNAVINNARHADGVTMVGIVPQHEKEISFIGSAVTQGRFLNAEDPYAIVVGQALIEKFETRIGHKLVLMSQDASGDIASRAFRIVGVFKAEMQATEKQFVFVTQSAAQQMLKLGDSINEIALQVPPEIPEADLAQNLRNTLAEETLEINTWQELLPLLMTYLKLYDSFIAIWYLVVFVAMGFGIVNTTLMAVFERMREFGLLKALGMKPGGILRSVLVESFLLLMLGLVLGNSSGVAGTLLLAQKGIDLSALAEGAEFAGLTRLIVPTLHLPDILLANVIVLILGLLVCLYPAGKAARFTPVEALRQT